MDMITAVANKTIVYNGRYYVPGNTYIISEADWPHLLIEGFRRIRKNEPARRDKSMHFEGIRTN